MTCIPSIWPTLAAVLLGGISIYLRWFRLNLSGRQPVCASIQKGGKPANLQTIQRVDKHRQETADSHTGKKQTTPPSTIAIAISGMDGSLTYVNPAFLKLWGYQDVSEVLGRNAREFWQTRQAAEKIISTLQDFGEWMGKSVAKRKDGSTFIAEISASIITGGPGQPSSMLAAFIDITERKQAEEALRVSEEQHRTILRTATSGFWLIDMQGHLLEVNEAYCQMSGYSEAELLSMNIADLDATETPGHTTEHMQKVIAQGPDRFETRHRRKDGSLYDIEISVQYKNGRFFAFLRDITERKQAEAALRASEERYQNFIAQSFEAIYRTEFDHPIDITLPVETQIDQIYENAYMAECNQALADMYHLPSVDSLIGTRIINAHGGKDNPVNRAAFRKFVENGYKLFNNETVELVADGKMVWFLSNTVGMVDGGYLVRMWGTSVDITEPKRAEAALRESEERYRSLFDKMLDGVYRSTHDGKFVDVNPAMVKIFGYNSREEMLKVDIKKELYFAEGERESLFLDTGQEKIETFRMRRKDGSEIWVEDHGHYVHDADGNVVFHEGILREVTERKHIDELVRVRLRLFEFAENHSLQEFMQKALDEIGEMTNSPIGFYHFVEPDQKTLSLQAWSTRTLKEFCSAERDGMHYSLDQAGVWVDCVHQRKPVIHNNYAALPHRKGMPAGHAQIIRELVVPTLRNERIVSILGVGNKPVNYDERDTELISYVSDIIWEIVERKRVEEALQRKNEYLEALQETTLDLLSQFELDTLLESIVRRAAVLMETNSGYLDLVEPETGQLKPQVGLGALAESLQHIAKPGEGIAGVVWETGKPILIEDYDQWTERIGGFSHNAIRSAIGVPLLSAGQVLGVLGLAYETKSNKAFKQEDIDLLSQFARLATIAIENARLFSAAQQELAERKRAEEGLRQLSRAVEQSPASIVITDTTGKIEYVNPKFSQVTGYSPDEVIGQNPRVLKTDQTSSDTHQQLWKTITSGEEWRGEFVNRKKSGEQYHELAIISPIFDGNGVITHYLAVKEDITERKQVEDELQHANQELHTQLDKIQRLQNELREQAIRDFLTGLYNRRYLSESLERETARALREAYPVSFVMIDVDHFKQVNDTYGHDVGDKVLQTLAILLIGKTRASDIVCRYGGEEFLVVLPNTSAGAAFQSAERWRTSFEKTRIPVGDTQIQATLSAGVAVYPAHGSLSKDVLVAADNAMYEAKALGRNRVVIWKNGNDSQP